MTLELECVVSRFEIHPLTATERKGPAYRLKAFHLLTQTVI